MNSILDNEELLFRDHREFDNYHSREEFMRKYYKNVLYSYLNNNGLTLYYIKLKKERRRILNVLAGNGWLNDYRNIQANALKMLKNTGKKRYNVNAARPRSGLTL